MRVFVETDTSWRTLPLLGGITVVRAARGRIVLRSDAWSEDGAVARLAEIVPCPGDRPHEAVLMLARGVRATVEGFPCLPAHVLRDRDEVSIEGGPRLLIGAYEAQPVRRFRADEPERRCARCSVALAPADTVGACPRCGGLFHHDESLRLDEEPAGQHGVAGDPLADARLDCDRYEDACPACGRNRSAMLWTPADLENDDA